VEQNKGQTTPTPKIEILCASCNQDEAKLATFWCENCLAHFCTSCDTKEHCGRVTQTHQRLTLKEKLKKPIFSRCVKHHQDKKFYCKDDKEFLCDVCVIDDHKLHDTVSVFKYADGAREELKKCLAPLLNAKVWEENLKTLQDSKEQHEVELKELKEKVRSLELKMTRIDEEMKGLEAVQGKVKTSHVVLQKSIEELGISDLVDQSKLERMKQKVSDIVAQFVPEAGSQDFEGLPLAAVKFQRELAHPDIVLGEGDCSIRGGSDGRYNTALLPVCLSKGIYEWKATVIGVNGHWHCAGIATKQACVGTGFTTDYSHSIGFGGSGNQTYNMNGFHQAPKPNMTFVFSFDAEKKLFKITGPGTQLNGVVPEGDFHPYFLVYKKDNGWRLDSFKNI